MNSLLKRFQLIKEDLIKGGMSDGMSLEDIAVKHKIDLIEIEKQFEKGLKVEKEHTSDESIASEIAKDHIFEDPNYYDKLDKMENGGTEQTKKEFKLSNNSNLFKRLLKLWDIDDTWNIFIEKYENPFKLELEAKKDNKKIEMYICLETTEKSINYNVSLYVSIDNEEKYNKTIKMPIDALVLGILDNKEIEKFVSEKNKLLK